MEAPFMFRTLLCGRCWRHWRVLVRKATETQPEDIYPICEACGPTTWLDLWLQQPYDLRPLPCGCTLFEHRLMAQGRLADPEATKIVHPSEAPTPFLRRMLDERMFQRDDDAPERQPWWYEDPSE